MIDTNTLEAKLNQLNQIKRLCDAKQAGIRFDQVDSNNICLIFFPFGWEPDRLGYTISL